MFDGNLGELVTITVQLAVTFAALLVEHEHLVAFYEGRNHFAYDLGAFDGGSAYFHVAVVVNEQHFLKFNSLTAFCFADVVDEELLALFNLELLTVNLYDCVHFNLYKRVFL